MAGTREEENGKREGVALFGEEGGTTWKPGQMSPGEVPASRYLRVHWKRCTLAEKRREERQGEECVQQEETLSWVRFGRYSGGLGGRHGIVLHRRVRRRVSTRTGHGVSRGALTASRDDSDASESFARTGSSTEEGTKGTANEGHKRERGGRFGGRIKWIRAGPQLGAVVAGGRRRRPDRQTDRETDRQSMDECG
ncbi:hypothetical protein TgHK011_006924 [Trichoderma gracile]|nr:hypothetical protein TgHK011_006924 [Trichoderma gracile]